MCRYWAIILFLFSVLVYADPAVELGNSFFNLENYSQAITEYRRFLFFNPDAPESAEISYKIGLAYRSDQLWIQAIQSMNSASQRTKNLEFRSKIQIDLAVTYLANNQPGLALLKLVNILSQPIPNQLYKHAFFLKGIAEIYLFSWEEARSTFRTYFGNTSRFHQIDVIISQAIKKPRKSGSVARILSTILPGSGQIYANNWADGFNALILNGLFGYTSFSVAKSGNYRDASFLTLFLWMRYYLGNRNNAKKIAYQVNRKQDLAFAQLIVEELQAIWNEE